MQSRKLIVFITKLKHGIVLDFASPGRNKIENYNYVVLPFSTL